MPPAIEEAGFTPGPLELTASGTVTRKDGGLVLRMDGRLPELALEAGEGVELSPGASVRVRGVLEAPDEGSPVLRVDSVEEAPSG